MAQVSSVVLNYAVRGADRAQRKDKQVRQSIKRTGRTARKQQGRIRRWMQRHQAAIAGIAAATVGAMTAIVRSSPTLRGELAGVRLGFSLFAMTVGEDVAPALSGLSDTVLDVSDAYSDLPEPIRAPISALIGFALAAGFAATALATLETVVAGTTIGAVLSAIAGYASTAGSALLAFATPAVAAATAILAVVPALGFLASDLLGITDIVDGVSESSNGFVRALSNVIFVIAGPLLTVLGVLFAFWKGGFGNALRVGHRFLEEMFNAFMRFVTGLGSSVFALGAVLRTGFETAWALAKAATAGGLNVLASVAERSLNTLMELVFHARELVPAAFAAMWDAAKQNTARALNAIISKAEGAINSLIEAANQLPRIDIEKVNAGRVDFGGGDPMRHFEGTGERARQAAQRNAVSFGRLPVDRVGDILSNAESRLTRRLQAVERREAAEKQRYAASSIQFEPPSATPQEGPQPDGRRVRPLDNSTTVEELNVTVPSRGDPQVDGEMAAREAMRLIEDKREDRS